MEITIRLGEIWTRDTNANGNSIKERQAEVKPAAVTHLGFVTLVSQVSQACCRELVDNSLTLANPAQILPVVVTWKCLRDNSCLHTSHCLSPLKEGFLLSLPYMFTDPRRQDWVQLRPSHFSFQRTCLTWIWNRILGQDILNPCSCSFWPPEKGTGRCRFQKLRKLRKTEGYSKDTKLDLVLAGALSQAHSWHIGLGLRSSAYHVTKPMSWCSKHNYWHNSPLRGVYYLLKHRLNSVCPVWALPHTLQPIKNITSHWLWQAEWGKSSNHTMSSYITMRPDRCLVPGLLHMHSTFFHCRVCLGALWRCRTDATDLRLD